MVETYSAVFRGFSDSCKIELIECLLKQLKKDSEKIVLPEDDFIPEKTAEQIIVELRESRKFGNRIIEPFE